MIARRTGECEEDAGKPVVDDHCVDDVAEVPKPLAPLADVREEVVEEAYELRGGKKQQLFDDNFYKSRAHTHTGGKVFENIHESRPFF